MANDKSVGRESDKFMLRFPEGMREQIAKAAKAAGRSMNSEILSRLASTFQAEAPQSRAEMLLEGESGATLKAVDNAMRHLALLSKHLANAKSLPSPTWGGGSVQFAQAEEPAVRMKADISTVPATLVDEHKPKTGKPVKDVRERVVTKRRT